MTSAELKKYRSGLPDELTLKDAENFYRCMAHYKITGMELEMAKQAYIGNPERNMASYAAMARKLPEPPHPWITPVLEPRQVKRA